jgi:hypothetical protein
MDSAGCAGAGPSDHNKKPVITNITGVFVFASSARRLAACEPALKNLAHLAETLSVSQELNKHLPCRV